MHFHAILFTLTIAGTALAGPSVTITNACTSTIYFKADAQASTGSIVAIPPQATSLKALTGMTNAFKFSNDPTVANNNQFDFSIDSTNTVYYDTSDIPGSPFPIAASAAGCPAVSCPGNCRKTEACPAVSDFLVQAC
jgi:hypothetical protein